MHEQCYLNSWQTIFIEPIWWILYVLFFLLNFNSNKLLRIESGESNFQLHNNLLLLANSQFKHSCIGHITSSTLLYRYTTPIITIGLCFHTCEHTCVHMDLTTSNYVLYLILIYKGIQLHSLSLVYVINTHKHTLHALALPCMSIT